MRSTETARARDNRKFPPCGRALGGRCKNLFGFSEGVEVVVFIIFAVFIVLMGALSSGAAGDPWWRHWLGAPLWGCDSCKYVSFLLF